LYVDGELKVEGVQDDFYTFNVSLNSEGHHTVQLYVWEPCCDGLNFGGFDVINPYGDSVLYSHDNCTFPPTYFPTVPDDYCGYVSSALFKSVYCSSEPASAELKTTVESGSQPSGYCTESYPDLFNYSSNQNLCSGGTYYNICKKYEWTLVTSHSGIFIFDQSNTPSGTADFETGILYVDGDVTLEGVRSDFTTFSVTLEGEGQHIVQLYV